ncbi:hypothetical protein ACFV0T_35050 [Streptomyces sp. NPDC059582]|uniref:hypothetical protein n=1 Tax=Streptomyces sp. NPDC059582 TaxID=3346875 RepID=UPI003698C0FE
MTVAGWEKYKNVPLVGHQVLLQYRKGTSGPFVTLKKLKTDRNGWATATVKATGRRAPLRLRGYEPHHGHDRLDRLRRREVSPDRPDR